MKGTETETWQSTGFAEKADLEFPLDYREETVPADVILCLTEHCPQESCPEGQDSNE